MDNIMNKRPSLQFYPADWLKAVDLQMCSMNTIGVWINILCRMWEAKEEGILNGTTKELALLVGATPEEFRQFLKDAETHLFADVTKSCTIVTIKCRRMNKTFLEREGSKVRMQKHRLQQSCNPSSSSSSTTKIYTAFQAYWNDKKNLPKIRVFEKDRISKLNSRMKEQCFADNWREVIDKIAESRFCLGENDRCWIADVSWVLANSDNYAKVLEGKYDGKKVTENKPKLCACGCGKEAHFTYLNEHWHSAEHRNRMKENK